MKVLVTGAAGFIGAALSEKLLARGDSVVGLDNFNAYYSPALKEARAERVQDEAQGRYRLIRQDFASYDELRSSLAGFDFESVVHLGAQAGVRYSLENPHSYARANLVGHLNLLEIARERSVRHMVYASSSSVYGANDKVPFAVGDRVDYPRSLYAATKRADELMSETYAHLYRLPLTGLRFFTVYGPWGRPDMMPWIFTSRILAGQPVPVFNGGAMQRDFTYIDDIIDGVVAALDKPPTDDGAQKPGGSTTPHAIYNIGNSRAEKLTRFIELLETACGMEAQLEMLPMQPGDVEQTYADIEAIQRDLGFIPRTTIEEGIPQFVNWYREYHQI